MCISAGVRINMATNTRKMNNIIIFEQEMEYANKHNVVKTVARIDNLKVCSSKNFGIWAFVDEFGQNELKSVFYNC